MLAKFCNTLSRNRKIILFLSSQAVSLFGSSLVQFAIMWHITRSTKSGIAVAIYAICSYLPQILASLFGGVLADRYNRKTLIILADGSIAVATLLLYFIMLSGVDFLIPIYIIAAIRSLGSGIQSPAVSAVLPQLVSTNQLMRVNSVNGTIQSAVMLVAPAIAGAVLAVSPLPSILLIDIFTAAIGIGILFFISIPAQQHEEGAATANFGKELLEGLRYAGNSFFIRRGVLYFVLFNILIVPSTTFNVLFVTLSYGDAYSYLVGNEMAFFAGSIIGGLILAAWGGFKNKVNTLIAGCLVFGVTTALMGFIPPFGLFLIIMFITGLMLPTFQAPYMALLQEKVPGTLLGRIFSLMQISNVAVSMVSTLLFGLLFEAVPIGFVMILCGLAVLAVTSVMWMDKRFRLEGLPTPSVENAPATIE